MPEAENITGPFDDVRELAMRPSAFDSDSSQKVYDALLGMGREGDFGRLGDGAKRVTTGDVAAGVSDMKRVSFGGETGGAARAASLWLLEGRGTSRGAPRAAPRP